MSGWIGWTLVSNKTYLYSQQIKGTENIIADSLTRYFHISNQTLTKKLNRTLPPQTASSFHIKQPPRDIISCISSLVAASTQSTSFPKPLQPSSLSTWIVGAHSSQVQASQKIIWKGSHKNIKQSLYHHPLNQCKESSLAHTGKILPHITVKSVISDVSASFRTHLRSNPNLETSGQTQLILRRKLRG